MSGMKSIRRTLKDGMVHETLMFMSPFKSPDPNERHVTIDTPCCDMDFLRTMMRDEYTPENLARLAQEYRRAPVRVEHLSHAIGKTDRSYIEDEMFNGVLEIYSIDSMRSPNGEPSPLEDFQREVIEQISRGELAFISLGVSYLADKVTGVPYPKPGFRIREVTLTRDPARPLAPYRHIALSAASASQVNAILSQMEANSSSSSSAPAVVVPPVVQVPVVPPPTQTPAAVVVPPATTVPPPVTNATPQGASVTPTSPLVVAPGTGDAGSSSTTTTTTPEPAKMGFVIDPVTGEGKWTPPPALKPSEADATELAKQTGMSLKTLLAMDATEVAALKSEMTQKIESNNQLYVENQQLADSHKELEAKLTTFTTEQAANSARIDSLLLPFSPAGTVFQTDAQRTAYADFVIKNLWNQVESLRQSNEAMEKANKAVNSVVSGSRKQAQSIAASSAAAAAVASKQAAPPAMAQQQQQQQQQQLSEPHMSQAAAAVPFQQRVVKAYNASNNPLAAKEFAEIQRAIQLGDMNAEGPQTKKVKYDHKQGRMVPC